MSESAASISIYQLRIVLRHVTPMVWRRVLVRSDTPIAQLHHIVQVVMGWEDIHLHRFRIHGREYGSSIGTTDVADRHAVTLACFRLRPPERFAYIYNFHAWWQHDIRLEQVLAPGARRQVPICIGGQHACPPEDCGGPADYCARLEARTSLAAFNDLALVADYAGRWLDSDRRGTEDEQVEVTSALERMAGLCQLIALDERISPIAAQ